MNLVFHQRVDHVGDALVPASDLMVRRGVSGAWFHGIPHVLAPGAVPLGNARVIGWEEPF